MFYCFTWKKQILHQEMVEGAPPPRPPTTPPPNLYEPCTITPQFLFHFTGRRRLVLCNGVLFAQKIPKELILLCMDYDVALRLENVEIQK